MNNDSEAMVGVVWPEAGGRATRRSAVLVWTVVIAIAMLAVSTLIATAGCRKEESSTPEIKTGGDIKTAVMATPRVPIVQPKPLESEPLTIQPEKIDASLVEKRIRTNRFLAVSLTVDAQQLAEGFPWSADGERLFLLLKDGHLLEVCLPEWKLQRRLALPGNFSHLALSKAGLVLARRSGGDLILVNLKTMAAKRSLKLAGAEHIAASPASPLVFSPFERKLRVVDVEADSLLCEVHTDERISCPEVTPDGRYFFCAGEFQSGLRRFAVHGGALVYEQSTSSRGSNMHNVDLSADSKYAAVSFGGGADPPPGYPRISYANYVYKVGDLSRPAVALYPGAYPCTVAVDPVTGRFYTQNSDHHLIVFSAKGDLEDAYRFVGEGGTRRLIAHPKGKKVLVITDRKVYWVELREAAAVEKAKPGAKTPGAGG